MIKILSESESIEQIMAEVLRANNVTEDDTPATMALKLANMTAVGDWLGKFITQDPLMEDTKERCRKLAAHRDTVLITGPTGTGKEILAQALGGGRQPFLPLNCAALSEALVESELFGHRKGSFTDAKEDHEGILAAAGDGTVYLDEIDKMPAKVQAKLLRAIQEHEIRQIGSVTYKPIYCRFVCSSKVPLDTLVEQSKFLEDLYARISVFELRTTALKERWDDVGVILQKLLTSVGKWPEDSEDCPILPENWRAKVEKFNVRGLESYQRNLVVFGTA